MIFFKVSYFLYRFQNITVQELRAQKWAKPNGEKISPTVTNSIRHFNKV